MNSMTGMGRARAKIEASYFQLEIKSINHRFCEVNVRLPNRFQAFELPIVQAVKKKISRGKVDVWLGEEKGEGEITFNKKALKNYYGFLQEIKKELKLTEPIGLTQIQNGSSFWMLRDNDVEKVWPSIQKLLNETLDKLIVMRKKEGDQLKKQIEVRIRKLDSIRKKIMTKKDSVLQVYKDKLRARMEKLLEGGAPLDESKLASEAAFFADRSDITEELDRLESHFAQIGKLMGSKEPAGRPMDFLIQEMNREWNTIGSKSQDVETAHWVVEAKSELEKIREQIQNIE